ncbi:MAG: hypothetical protein AAGD86_01565 [Pseudomonadota bacterium]
MTGGWLKALLGALAVAYPLLVYAGIGHFRPAVFGALLAALAMLRLTGLPSAERHQLLLPTALALGYAIAVAVTDNALLLRFYPVLISATMLLAFGRTLLEPPSLIERFLAARGTELDDAGRAYVRNVTAVWCVFFIVNGGIAAWTALFGSWELWALYNGLLAYLLMGGLFCVELIVRHFYRARLAHQQQADG